MFSTKSLLFVSKTEQLYERQSQMYRSCFRNRLRCFVGASAYPKFSMHVSLDEPSKGVGSCFFFLNKNHVLTRLYFIFGTNKSSHII